MFERILRFGFFLALVAACAYLMRVDYASKLETDVSSLLPDSNTQEARLLRRMISQDQGRSVYIELGGLPADAKASDQLAACLLRCLKSSDLVAGVLEINSDTNAQAFRTVAGERFALLFPKWWARKKAAYEREKKPDLVFQEWGARSAVADMEAFLESPPAVELARPGLIDPLLLNISTILELSESGGVGPANAGRPAHARYFWMTLAASPLKSEVQASVAELFTEIDRQLSEQASGVRLQYGGLVKLAGASRQRIQREVLKINVLSVMGVLAVAILLLRKPWKLALAIPTVLVGAIGALSVSFQVFDTVNVVVLIVGSILIGTSIDYAVHTLFVEVAERDFPSKRLIGLACFSTVAGFMVLLFADLSLIRQIGVFVGAGLLCAYLMVRVSLGGSLKADEIVSRIGLPAPRWERVAIGPVVALLFIAGGLGLFKVEWQDDVRNLEVPDNGEVEADLQLRERLGGTDDAGAVFLTTGSSYADVLENEKALMACVGQEYPGVCTFGLSRFLPCRSELVLLEESSGELPRFFDALECDYRAAGYEVGAFGGFFDEASGYLRRSRDALPSGEAGIARFVDSLAGPMAGVIGQSDGFYWSLCSIDLPLEKAGDMAARFEHSTLFSQLGFLNQSLSGHRRTLLDYGVWAIGVVVLSVLIFMGLKKGLIIVLFPLLGGLISIGLSGLLFEHLNLFHLIGSFLGGAIALDYALFAVEAFSRNRAIPFSVWLSAGTTTASFIALGLSVIPVVRGLGVMVSLIACVTMLLLHSSGPYVKKFFAKNASNRPEALD